MSEQNLKYCLGDGSISVKSPATVFRLERKWLGRQEQRFAAKSNWTRRKFGRREIILPQINSVTATYFFSLGSSFPFFEVKTSANSTPGSLPLQDIEDRESLGLSVKSFQSPGEGNSSVTSTQVHHICSLLLYLVQELGVPYFLAIFRVIELR